MSTQRKISLKYKVLIGLCILLVIGLFCWKRIAVEVFSYGAKIQLKNADYVMHPDDWALRFMGQTGLKHLRSLANDPALSPEKRKVAQQVYHRIKTGGHVFNLKQFCVDNDTLMEPLWRYVYERDLLPDDVLLRNFLNDITHEDRKIQWWALGSLSDMGENAAPAIPKLIEYLDHESNPHRGLAIWVIGDIDPKSEIVLNKLTSLLRDKSDEVKIAAARTLGLLGHTSKEAKKALIDGLYIKVPPGHNDKSLLRSEAAGLLEIYYKEMLSKKEEAMMNWVFKGNYSAPQPKK